MMPDEVLADENKRHVDLDVTRRVKWSYTALEFGKDSLMPEGYSDGWAGNKALGHSAKTQAHYAVKSWFAYNNLPLQPVKYRIEDEEREDLAPFDLVQLRKIVEKAEVKWRSAFLVLLQSAVRIGDLFAQVGLLWPVIKDQMSKKTCVIKINVRGMEILHEIPWREIGTKLVCLPLYGATTRGKIFKFFSVPNYSPVTIRQQGLPDVVTIEDLWASLDVPTIDIPNAEVKVPLETVYTKNSNNNGWVKIKSIIRHSYSGKLVRIHANGALVDTSPNHSIFLRKNGHKILVNADSVRAGDELWIARSGLTAWLRGSCRSFIGNADLAWLYGFFLAEGTANTYNVQGKHRQFRASLVIFSNKDIKLLDKAKEIIRRELHRTPSLSKSTGCLRLAFSDRAISAVFRKMFYTSCGDKKVPQEILNAPVEVQSAFLKGYLDGDGTHVNYKASREHVVDGYLGFTTKSQVLAQGILTLLKQIGYKCMVRIFENKSIPNPNVLSIHFSSYPTTGKGTKKDKPSFPSQVKATTSFEYRGYLYDFETEGHEFITGIGDIVVHNTFVSGDAVDELDRYVKERGEPAKGERIWECDKTRLQKKIHIYAIQAGLMQRDKGNKKGGLRYPIYCFSGDTTVAGEFNPIEAIERGQHVIGLQGHDLVTHKFSRAYTGKILRIRASGMLPIQATEDHPFLVVTETGWQTKKNGRSILRREFGKPIWKTAANLKAIRGRCCSNSRPTERGDYLLIPRSVGNSRRIKRIGLSSFAKMKPRRNFARRVMLLKRVSEGQYLSAIAREWNRSPQFVNYYLQWFKEQGYIRQFKGGHIVTYAPTPKGEKILSKIAGNVIREEDARQLFTEPTTLIKLTQSRSHWYQRLITSTGRGTSFLPLNDDTAWLLGLYVAEGSSGSRRVPRVVFNLGHDEVHLRRRIRRIAMQSLNLRTCICKQRTSTAAVIQSAPLGRALREWCGHTASEKKVPEFIFYHTNRSITRAFLEGYWSGDGCVQFRGKSKNLKYMSAFTRSRKLALQLQLMVARLGGKLGVSRTRKQIVQIEGRTTCSNSGYCLQRIPRQMVTNGYKVIRKYIAVRVRSVKPSSFNGVVYNIETGSGAYLANNVIVHNCHRIRKIFKTTCQQRGVSETDSEFLCLHGETCIAGDFRSIKDVGPTSHILGASGHGSVVRTFERPYSSSLLEVKACGMLPIRLTPEHPVKVASELASKHMVWRNGIRTTWFNRQVHSPQWKPAYQLMSFKGRIAYRTQKTPTMQGDYLIVPRTRYRQHKHHLDLLPFVKDCSRLGGCRKLMTQSIQRTGKGCMSFPLNTETAWFLGLYVAEGSRSAAERAQLTLGAKEQDLITRAKEILRRYLNLKAVVSYRGNVASVLICSAVLSRALRAWCGSGSYHKQVPDFIFYHRDPRITQAFIKGYFDGDGCIEKRKNGALSENACTVSRKLALQLQLLFARQGKFLSVRYQKPTAAPNTRPAYRMLTRLNRKGRLNAFLVKPNALFVRIRSVSQVPHNGSVFNLETSDGTYLANNAIVHNCGHKRSGVDKIYDERHISHPEVFAAEFLKVAPCLDLLSNPEGKTSKATEAFIRRFDPKWVPANLESLNHHKRAKR